MANPAADTFVESGADVDLSAHTPTGPNAGTSWNLFIAGGQINVIAATDLCQDIATGNGNRYRMTDDLGFDEMDVAADANIVTPDANIAPGVVGRVPNSGTGVGGWDFTYESTQWKLSDGVTTVTLTESTPSGVHRYRISCRQTGQAGYVDDVLKVSTTSNTKTGNTRGGIALVNFSGGANKMTLDNFSAVGIPVPMPWQPRYLGAPLVAQ